MRKGISPLVASVLLIAITMAIAAILANWTTSFTRQSLPSTTCIGGEVGVVSDEYPRWDADNGRIAAVVEATSVSLEKFRFVVLFNDDTTKTYDDGAGLSLSAGEIGTIYTPTTGAGTFTGDPCEVRAVQILTSCSEVKSGWYDLQIETGIC